MLDPQTLADLEAECALLGAAMLDAAVADEQLATVPEAAFAREAHRHLWAALRTVRQGGGGTDVVTLADALQRAGHWPVVEAHGGITYLADLVASIPAPALAGQYAQAVVDAAVRRTAHVELLRAAAVCTDTSRGIDALQEAVAAAGRLVAEAAAGRRRTEALSTLAMRAYQQAETLYMGDVGPGIPTGLPALDSWTGGGLHRGELWVLGGRPGVGKSSLAQQVAAGVARAGGAVYVASAEMSGDTVGQRALAAESGVDGRRIRGSPPPSEAEWADLARALGRIGGYGALVQVDTSSRTMGAVCAQARRLRPLTLVVVDHLQQLRGDTRDETRAQAVGRMVGEAKALAVDLDCAVLVVSQLNRAAPSENRRPRPSDLRDSGEIEQQADLVALLHRPDDAPPAAPVELIIAKHRNGELGTLRLRHDRPTGRWATAAPGDAAAAAPERPRAKTTLRRSMLGGGDD
jgi:replicative DNA helicase